MNKKGAIEFSMTTIMVVIIGVAVLALGLAWIRGTFSQVSIITEGSLEAAETIVGEVAFSGKASAPATISMEKNDAKKFKVLVRNVGTVPKEYLLKLNNPNPDTCFSKVDVSGYSVADPDDSIGIKLEANGVGEFVGGVISKNTCSDTDTAILTMKILERDVDKTDWTTNAIDYSTEAVVLQIA